METIEKVCGGIGESHGDFAMVLYTSEYRSGQKYQEKEYIITQADILKITDNDRWYELNEQQEKYELNDPYYPEKVVSQSHRLKPRYVKGLDPYLAEFAQALYDLRLIDRSAFLSFCEKRLQVYAKRYHDREEMYGYREETVKQYIAEFFDLYMPQAVKCVIPSGADFCKMFEMRKSAVLRDVVLGGEFCGCFTDEFDRVRPRTSRKVKVTVNDWMKLMERILLEIVPQILEMGPVAWKEAHNLPVAEHDAAL